MPQHPANIKASFLCAELIELKYMGHASIASFRPKEMVERLEELVKE